MRFHSAIMEKSYYGDYIMKHFLFISFFLTFFYACQKENVEIPDTGRKIVINGLITTDSLINVRISGSEYYTSNPWLHESPPFTGAIVNFYNNNTCIDSLYYSTHNISKYGDVYYTGNYLSESVSPLPGKEYKITVSKSGFPDATASITIPRLVNIERVDTSRIESLRHDYAMKCKLEFTDPPSERNYYLLNIVRVSMNPFIKEYLTFDCEDPVIEEELCGNGGSMSSESNKVFDNKYGYAFSDKLIDGKKYSLNFSFEGNNYLNDPRNIAPKTSYIYYFRLISITEGYFKFIQTFNLFNSTRWNPLAERVQVYSNVSGGYGIFAGGAVSADSIILHD
jgi:hypothetical protein